MVNIFGNKNALIGSLDLLFIAIYVVGAFVFRKVVANDTLERGFSVVGSSACSLITFILIKSLTTWSIKISFGIGLAVWVIAGFLLGELIGDGWAGGSE